MCPRRPAPFVAVTSIVQLEASPPSVPRHGRHAQTFVEGWSTRRGLRYRWPLRRASRVRDDLAHFDAIEHDSVRDSGCSLLAHPAGSRFGLEDKHRQAGAISVGPVPGDEAWSCETPGTSCSYSVSSAASASVMVRLTTTACAGLSSLIVDSGRGLC
jgi:hypothetical protein